MVPQRSSTTSSFETCCFVFPAWYCLQSREALCTNVNIGSPCSPSVNTSATVSLLSAIRIYSSSEYRLRWFPGYCERSSLLLNLGNRSNLAQTDDRNLSKSFCLPIYQMAAEVTHSIQP